MALIQKRLLATSAYGLTCQQHFSFTREYWFRAATVSPAPRNTTTDMQTKP